MKTLKTFQITFSLLLVLFTFSLTAKDQVATNNLAGFSTFTSLDGTWLNSNRNALPKIYISGNNTKLRAWGKCHPTNCDWGTVKLYKYGSAFKATFNSHVAKRTILLRVLADGRLKMNATYDYKDSRATKRLVYYFKQAGPKKIDGIWTNLNPNALPKLYVYANSTKIKAWGKCHPTNCEWGSTYLTKVGSSYRAIFNDHVAKRTLILTPSSSGRLKVNATYDYKDSRPTKRFTYYFKVAALFKTVSSR